MVDRLGRCTLRAVCDRPLVLEQLPRLVSGCFQQRAHSHTYIPPSKSKAQVLQAAIQPAGRSIARTSRKLAPQAPPLPWLASMRSRNRQALGLAYSALLLAAYCASPALAARGHHWPLRRRLDEVDMNACASAASCVHAAPVNCDSRDPSHLLLNAFQPTPAVPCSAELRLDPRVGAGAVRR